MTVEATKKKFFELRITWPSQSFLRLRDQISYIWPFLFRNMKQQEEEAPADNVEENENSLTELDGAEKECCKINF